MTIFLNVKVRYVINQTIYIIASLVSTIVDTFCNAHSITYLRCFLFLLKRIYKINHFFFQINEQPNHTIRLHEYNLLNKI